MAILRLFAQAREAAGLGRDDVDGATVAEVLASAVERYGQPFAIVLRSSTVWLNGEPSVPEAAVARSDEVAILPPVSGG